MRIMKQLAMLALGLTLMGGTLAYADSDEINGDFDQTPPIDKFRVTCGGATELCASIADDGPFDDNVFKVRVKCLDSKQKPKNDVSVAPAGGEAEACVSNCSKAKVFLSCLPKVNHQPSFCDDDYVGTFDCDGEDITVIQTG